MKRFILFSLMIIGTTIYSQKNTDLTFTSNIDIRKDAFQMLLSSQNYDSNYAVYVRFKTEPRKNNENEDKGKRRLIGAEFKLLNYKAKVFMGIKEVIFEKLDDTRNGDLSSHKIKIYVKGHMKWDNSSFKYTPSNDDEIYLTSKETLVSERYLLPMFYTVLPDGVKEKTPTTAENEDSTPSYFITEYEDDIGILEVQPHNYYVVDTEYFHIDGLSFIVKKTNYDNVPIENMIKMTRDIDMLIPGPRCKTAYSSLQ